MPYLIYSWFLLQFTAIKCPEEDMSFAARNDLIIEGWMELSCKHWILSTLIDNKQNNHKLVEIILWGQEIRFIIMLVFQISQTELWRNRVAQKEVYLASENVLGQIWTQP